MAKRVKGLLESNKVTKNRRLKKKVRLGWEASPIRVVNDLLGRMTVSDG